MEKSGIALPTASPGGTADDGTVRAHRSRPWYGGAPDDRFSRLGDSERSIAILILVFDS